MDQAEIGKFIAGCRKEKQLTQAQLAERLGITDRAVSKWECGKSMPDASIMLELCGILGITVNELLSGEKMDMENDRENYEKKADENLLALTQKNENNLTKNNLIFLIFSSVMATGVVICLICDTAVSGGLTWSPIPVCAVFLAWAVLFPVVLCGRRGVWGSLMLISILIIPYLFILSRQVGVHAVFTVGAATAAVGIVFLWLAAAIFHRMGKKNVGIALGMMFLLAIPFTLLINGLLAWMLNAAVNVWDTLTLCILLMLSVDCFTWHYVKKKRIK